MAPWNASDTRQRFDNWLADWRRFQQTASVGGQLAVLNALAAFTPDSPYPLLDEIGMWAGECGLASEWAALRGAFEGTLWPKLAKIETRRDEMPAWYMEAFYWMPTPYRRAALYVSFIDFMLEYLPDVDAAPFTRFQEWLVGVARCTHTLETSSAQGLRSLIPSSRQKGMPLPVPQFMHITPPSAA